MSERRLLFSVTAKDFEMQTFRSGGKGGQNQNKVSSGVRLVHRDSGARGEARDSRDQPQNKRAAFLRLLETKEWKAWHRLQVVKSLGQVARAEAAVEEAMDPANLRIEVFDGKGWVPAQELAE